MLPWELDLFLNVALVAFAFWVRGRPRPRRGLERLSFLYGALFVLASFFGVALGVMVLLDPFSGDTFDPSHSTLTILGCPLAVSCAATGVTAFLLPAIVATVMVRRARDGAFPKMRPGKQRVADARRAVDHR